MPERSFKGIIYEPEFSNGDGVAHFFVLDNKIRVALVVVKNDKNLRLKVIVHAGVVEVAGDTAGVHRRGSPHGVVAHRVPPRQHFCQEHVMDSSG